MTGKSFLTTIKMVTILYIREFASPFFSLAFPVGLVLIFGGIFGNEPDPMLGGRGTMDMMIPAYVAMAIAVNGLMTLPLNLSEYVTNKVYKRFDATPMGKGNVVIVQVLVYFLAALVSAATVVILGWWLYRINILGAWYVIAFAMLLSCAAIFSIGFFIAAVFKNAKNAQVASYIVYFVMLFLSGTTLPLQIMPHNIRTVANFLPLTHAVSLLQEAFDGQPLGEQWVAMVVLTGVLIFCGGVGGVMYRKRKWA